MKITFPHMGNTFIVAKALFDYLGVDYVIPPAVSKKDLEIGIKYCPEMACMPLKINIGNFIQAIEQGADTIVMVGGYGPCRFGYYAEMHNEILQANGFNVEVISLEISKGHVSEFLRKIRHISNNKSMMKVLKAVLNAVKTAEKVDEIERLTFKTRPREKNRGETDAVYRRFLEDAVNTGSIYETMKLIENTIVRLREIELDMTYKPLKVGIVGEIYSIIEPFTNFNIERKLGYAGIEVERSLMVSGWINEHLVKNLLFMKKSKEYKSAAQPFLGAMIGGHAQETIGNSVLFSNKKYDGVIQIYPLNCMPEIVAKSILPNISTKLGIPVLTLVIDEMTGEEGLKTRIEAFTDLLISRREKERINEGKLLSWN